MSDKEKKTILNTAAHRAVVDTAHGKSVEERIQIMKKEWLDECLLKNTGTAFEQEIWALIDDIMSEVIGENENEDVECPDDPDHFDPECGCTCGFAEMYHNQLRVTQHTRYQVLRNK